MQPIPQEIIAKMLQKANHAPLIFPRAADKGFEYGCRLRSGLSGDSLASTTASSKAATDEASIAAIAGRTSSGPGAMEGGKAGSLVWKAGAGSLPRLFRLLSVDHGQ